MKKNILSIIIILFLIFINSCGNSNKPLNIVTEDSHRESVPEYNESPVLKELVNSGALPPVKDRLSNNPKLIKVDKSTGKYGGIWHIPIRENKNQGVLVRVIGYEGLVSWDPEWTKVVPNIAQSWSVNSDSTVFTFKLREGMRWSDGELFTADDILFFYEISKNKELNPSGIKNWLTTNGTPVVIKKIDNYTVSFTFSSSYGLFLQKMATTAGLDITGTPKHYLESFLKENNPSVILLAEERGYDSWQHMFNFKKNLTTNTDLPTINAWLLEDTYYPLTTNVLKAKRNPYYWKVDSALNQLPYIENLEFIVCKDQNEIDSRTIDGDFEMSLSDLPESSYHDYELQVKENKINFFSKTPSIMNNMTIEFNWNHPNSTKREIFKDKNFRIALSHGINRELIIKDIYNGNGTPYQLAPRPESTLYNERLAKQYTEFNLDLAKRILSDSGYVLNTDGRRVDSNGNVITISIIAADLFGKSWPKALEYIKKDWGKLGIEVNIEIMEWSKLDEYRNNALHDVLIWQGSGGLEVKIIPDYYFPAGSESGYAMKWMWWYRNIKEFYTTEEPPELVKKQMNYFDKLKSTANVKEQDILMNKILDIAADQFYSFGIALPGKSFGITKYNFKNVPTLMPQSWAYPTPAPTNPCQYYFD